MLTARDKVAHGAMGSTTGSVELAELVRDYCTVMASGAETADTIEGPPRVTKPT